MVISNETFVSCFIATELPDFCSDGLVSNSSLEKNTKSKVLSPVRRLYSVLNHKKTGAECAYAGEKLTPIAGEITKASMHRITTFMKLSMSFNHTSRVVDIGCGQGKPNLHFAVAVGPELNVGIEIIPWRWYQATTNLLKVCDVALDGDLPFPNCYFKRGNIREAESLDPFTHIYMFCTG